MREYLDPVVKADQCAQNLDNIGIVPNNPTDLEGSIRAVFKSFQQAGLKLTIEKWHFKVRQIEFLGKIVTSEEISPQTHKVQKFPNNWRFHQSKKAL